MKYLTLHITSNEGELLYARDVDVVNLCETFIRQLVSDFVKKGVIREGEHYTARLIPRYGNWLRQQAVVTALSAPVPAQNTWVVLDYEPNTRPDQPVIYFTLELHVRERNFLIACDIYPHELSANFIAYGVEQALLGLGVLQNGQLYRIRFYAKDDNDAQFDKEHLPTLQQKAASLIEFLSDEPEAPAFPFRDPSAYPSAIVVGQGQPQPDDIRIFVRRGTHDALLQAAKASDQVELGGILVGNVYRAADGGRLIVEVSDFIVSEGLISSATELRYTFESWQSHQAQLREQFPGKRIVGWYHTHVVTIPTNESESVADESEEAAASSGTTMFFSQHDVFLHSQFFADEWYVALVLDPWGKNIFFQWKNGRIVPCHAYYLYADLGVA
jgi:proteasome lid subunit RPN8/RPN11